MRRRGRRAREHQVVVRTRALLSPLAVRDYRLIWSAQLASTLGDWATRLALAVVVLERTGSAAVMSLVVACSLIAWLGPGQLLAQIADVYGRRVVMIVSDVVRALVFASLALPVPTWALLLGAAVAGLATPPFAAARSAATRELVPAEQYGPAMALASMTVDAGVVLGYAFGGLILAVASPQGALLLNAATFVLSAVLVARLPETRHAAEGDSDGSALRGGLAAVFGQPIVRMAVGVAVLAAASGVGIESLVVVYTTRDLHGPPWAPGALLAGIAGMSFVITAMLPNRGVRSTLLRAAGLTSLVGAVVTAGGFLTGSDAGAVVGILASGAFFAVIAPANVVVGPILPAAVRASAFSVLMGVLVVCQSLGASGAGTLADHVTTAQAAALVCIPGFLGGLWVLGARRRPAGYEDDIEAPVGVDLQARLASPPEHPRDDAREHVVLGGPLAAQQVGRHAAPYSAGYSNQT